MNNVTRKIIVMHLALLMGLSMLKLVVNAEDIISSHATDAQVEKWTNWLNDKSLFGREEGASALARSNNQKAVPGLLKALKDDSETVRQYPAGYLWKYKDDRVKPALIEALKNENSLLVQRMIISSINKIGTYSEDEKIINEYSAKLINEIRDNAIYGKDNHRKLRAIWELVNLMNEDPRKYESFSIAMLNSITVSEKDKILALRLLEKINTNNSISAIEKATKDSNKNVKSEAEFTLKKLGRRGTELR
jgi:HEAT repeat protein